MPETPAPNPPCNLPICPENLATGEHPVGAGRCVLVMPTDPPTLFPEPPSTLAPSSSTPEPEAAVVRAARALLDAFDEFSRRTGVPLAEPHGTALRRALRAADEAALIPGASLHYGCRVVDLGDDGEDWAIAGHVDRRLALSVVRRYVREQVGEWGDHYDEGLAEAKIEQRYIVADYSRDDEDEVWQYVEADAPGARPVTFVML